MQREAFKMYGATEEQLDKAIAVMIDHAIDAMPAGMVRGLTPEEAFDVVTRGLGRFVFKPVSEAPPEYMRKAILAHVEHLAHSREPTKLDWFEKLLRDSMYAEGVREEEIEGQLAELRERFKIGPPRAGEQLEPDAGDEGDDKGSGDAIPEGMKGALLKLTDEDAIALVGATEDVEQLEQWLEAETLAKATRKPVLEALETKIEKLYEGEGAGAGSSSSAPATPTGQGAPSPTAPGDGAPPEARPTPKPPSSAPTGAAPSAAVPPSSAAVKPATSSSSKPPKPPKPPRQ